MPARDSVTPLGSELLPGAMLNVPPTGIPAGSVAIRSIVLPWSRYRWPMLQISGEAPASESAPLSPEPPHAAREADTARRVRLRTAAILILLVNGRASSP